MGVNTAFKGYPDQFRGGVIERLTQAAGSIAISPLGMVNAGTPNSVSVTKYGHSDSITISGYGRLQ